MINKFYALLFIINAWVIMQLIKLSRLFETNDGGIARFKKSMVILHHKNKPQPSDYVFVEHVVKDNILG